MSILNPLFLLAGAAVAVPIFLHLFQRHQTRRLSFPALRYLERTEKEHARKIRVRQLLLLLARVVALLLIVGAGARIVVRGRGAAHEPTSVVIVLDNSMSSGLVVGERRVLDELKQVALETVDAAGDEDRFWVIRAGEPWLPAIPGGAAETRAAIAGTEASDAAGDLTAALERAVGLLANAETGAREIQLLSDLQRTAFAVPGAAPAGDLNVVTWTPTADAPANRALTRLVVGGGLPPLEGQRTEVTVGALGGSGDSTRVPVRVVVNDRIRGAATLRGGSEASIGLPPAGSGWIRGYADADPDDLRADDRRWFAYRSRPAPTVALDGDAGLFLDQALSVLRDAGRLRVVEPGRAELLVAHAGSGLEDRGPGTALLIVPAADPTVLPALNRRLVDAGIPWQYGPVTETGETQVEGYGIPAPFEGVTVRERFALARAGESDTPTRTLAEAAGRPWAVEGTAADGHHYLLLGSPLATAATSLPTSTGMLRFVDWAASEWAGAGGAPTDITAGDHLPAPGGATSVRFPSGAQVEIDATRTVRGTGEAGLYTFLADDSVLAVVALNPPADESRLERLEADEYATAIGPEVIDADDRGSWRRAIYRARQGPELWWPLLAAVLALLLVESVMATSGGRQTRPREESPAPVPPGAPGRPVAADPAVVSH